MIRRGTAFSDTHRPCHPHAEAAFRGKPRLVRADGHHVRCHGGGSRHTLQWPGRRPRHAASAGGVSSLGADSGGLLFAVLILVPLY